MAAKVYELTPRLEAEVLRFGAVLEAAPPGEIVDLFRDPPPKTRLPQRWITTPDRGEYDGEDDAA